MITKAHIQFIRALHNKPARKEHGLFLAEGVKVIEELLPQFTLHSLYSTEDELFSSHKATIISPKELEKMSTLSTPQKAVAIFHQKERILPKKFHHKEWLLALDHITDPGNLGTIIRLADWFGIDHILCSANTVEVWNPKVVQATMGSIGRVQCHYGDLISMLHDSALPVIATSLQGTSMKEATFPTQGILLMGNESLGVSKELLAKATEHIRIPEFPHHLPASSQAESLNVASATAICLYAIFLQSNETTHRTTSNQITMEALP